MNSIGKTLLIKNSGVLQAQDGRLSFTKKKDESVIEMPINDLRSIYIDDRCNVQLNNRTLLTLSESSIPVYCLNDKKRPHVATYIFKPNVNRSLNIRRQIEWKEIKKQALWRMIVRNKVSNQEWCLLNNALGKSGCLTSHLDNLSCNDDANVEGVVAKEYFKRAFGDGFTRDDDKDIRNYALNYGYSVLTAEITKCIIDAGYLTELGVHHDNASNTYNLTYDLIEPFRPLIDDWILKNVKETFEFDDKAKLSDVIYQPVRYNKRTYQLKDAIYEYVNDCIGYLNGKQKPEEVLLGE